MSTQVLSRPGRAQYCRSLAFAVRKMLPTTAFAVLNLAPNAPILSQHWVKGESLEGWENGHFDFRV